MFGITFAWFSLFAEIVVMVSILFTIIIIIIIIEWAEHDLHGRVEWMSNLIMFYYVKN